MEAAILWGMAAGSGDGPDTGWAAIRPVLVGLLVASLLFVVVVLALVRPQGWWAPFAAFGSLLIGAVWFEAWALRHRHDDD